MLPWLGHRWYRQADGLARGQYYRLFEDVKPRYAPVFLKSVKRQRRQLPPKPKTARLIWYFFLAYQMLPIKKASNSTMVMIIWIVIFFSYSAFSISFLISSTLNLANKYWRSWTGKRWSNWSTAPTSIIPSLMTKSMTWPPKVKSSEMKCRW